MADIFEIAGRIHSTSQEHVTSPADEILDTSQNKKQHLINSDVARHESEINSPTNGLNKRVADIEALGQIGDTPVETNASNIISNTSLNGKVPSASAVNGVYNAVVANAGYYTCDSEASTAAKVVEASGYVLTVGGCIKIKMTNANSANNATLNINSTGAKVLYYNGESVSATNSWEEGETVEVYYDGTSYYANNVAGGSGSGDGAFDVSATYPTSGVDSGNTYTLEGALAVLNANLSIRKKKGGMSIKFIRHYDGKYIQVRCMAQNFTTDVTQWQGVNGVLDYSLNIVPNKILKDEFDKINGRTKNYGEGSLVNSAGGLTANVDYGYSDYIPCEQGDTVAWSPGGNTSYQGAFFCFYDVNKTFLQYFTANATPRTVTAPVNAKYIRGSIYLANKDDSFCAINGSWVWTPLSQVEGTLPAVAASIPSIIDNLDSENITAALSANQGRLIDRIRSLYVIGNNTTIVTKIFEGVLQKSHKYKIHLLNKDFDVSGDTLTTNHERLRLQYIIGSSETNIITVQSESTLKDFYQFDTPAEASEIIQLEIRIRATRGEKVYFLLEDITKDISIDSVLNNFSKNPAENAAVKSAIDTIVGRTENYHNGKFVDIAGNLTNNNNYGYSDFIPCKDGDILTWAAGNVYDGIYFCFYDENKAFITYKACNANPRTVAVPANSKYVRGSYFVANINDAYCIINDNFVWKPLDAATGLIPSVIDNLDLESTTAALSANQGRLLDIRKCITVLGNDTSVVSKTFIGLLSAGRKYQIHLLNKDFDTSGDTITTVHERLRLEYTNGAGTTTNIVTVYNNGTLSDSYDFEIPSSNTGVITLTVRIRATLNVPVYFTVEDITKDVTVDDTLNAYSKSAIENSAVTNALDSYFGRVKTYSDGSYINSAGGLTNNVLYGHAINPDSKDMYFPVSEGDRIEWHFGSKYEGMGICFYNSSKTKVGFFSANVNPPRTVTASEGAAYMSFSYTVASRSSAYLKRNGVIIWKASDRVEGMIQPIVDALNSAISNSFNLNGVCDVDIDAKVLEFTDLFQTAGAEIQSFLFFTDPHIFNNVSEFDSYILNIQNYYRNTPTDFVLCGGDWLQSNDSVSQAVSRLAKVDAICNRMLEPFYDMVGNHDTNYQGTEELSTTVINNLWFRKYGKAYYDFVNTNTRYYVFDTGKDNDHSMSAYRTGQLTWLADSLLQNTDDDHIILCFHIYYYNTTNIEGFAQNIINIAAAYNSRGTITVDGVTKDFTSATGKVHAAIVGHSHRDFNVYNSGIPVIATINTQSGNTPSYDLVLVDYTNDVINLVRVGTGSSRTISLTEPESEP